MWFCLLYANDDIDDNDVNHDDGWWRWRWIMTNYGYGFDKDNDADDDDECLDCNYIHNFRNNAIKK